MRLYLCDTIIKKQSCWGVSMARVLIADDIPDTREILMIGLQRAGFEVIQAENGTVALRMVETEKPDVLLLDLRLPEIDGLTVLKQLRAHGAYPPIIIMTASNHPVELERARAAGADAYILKPFRLAEVVSVVRQYVAQTA